MRKMFVFILFSLFAVSEAAAEKKEFTAKIILTKAVNINDQFGGILPGRPPVFPQVSKVICGEPFYAKIAFWGASAKNGSFSLNGKIIFCSPDGKKEKISLKDQSINIKGSTKGVFLLPQDLVVRFEPQEPEGTYTFELELTDRNSGTVSRSSAKLEYVPRIPAVPENEALKKIGNYYRAPCPENILPAFSAYLKQIPAQKKKEKKNFNPLPQLALFYFLLKENPQYVNAFAEKVARLTDSEHRLFGGIILNFLSPEAAQKLSAAEKTHINRTMQKNPFEIKEVTAPWHLDIFWSEFFIRGTRAPVLQVVNALLLGKDSISIQNYRKITNPTPADQRKLMNGLMAMAAEWSIRSIAKQHPLVRYYIEAALHRKEIKDPFAGAVSAKAIGLQVRFTPTGK